MAFAVGVWLFAGSVLALECQKNKEQWRAWQKAGEPYSTAVCDQTDPQQLYEMKKAILEQKPVNRLALPARIADVARTAFEAGHNDEARAYAEQAFATAAEGFYINVKPDTYGQLGK